MDKNNHKISIIITVRNEEKNIEILLKAILMQTYKDYEVVINDNGSIDNTVNIIKKYQTEHNNIKLIQSTGKSIGEGRNTAIMHSTGNILAVMDAGIYPENIWLERLVKPLIDDSSIDVAWGHIIFDTKSRVTPSKPLSLALVFLTKYSEDRKNGKNVPSSAFRKKVWRELGKFPEIQLPIEDLCLIDAISEKGFNCIHVNNAKAYYYNYPSSYYNIYRKWVISAYSSFIVKKSELGFLRQFIIFGLFFVTLALAFIDINMVSFVCIYIIAYFLYKIRLNVELSKKVFSNYKTFLTVLILFFILNFARLSGVIKAIITTIIGKVKKIEIIDY